MRRLRHLNNNGYVISVAGNRIFEFVVATGKINWILERFIRPVKESDQIDIALTILSILNVSYRLVQSSIKKLPGLNQKQSDNNE